MIGYLFLQSALVKSKEQTIIRAGYLIIDENTKRVVVNGVYNIKDDVGKLDESALEFYSIDSNFDNTATDFKSFMTVMLSDFELYEVYSVCVPNMNFDSVLKTFRYMNKINNINFDYERIYFLKSVACVSIAVGDIKTTIIEMLKK